MMGAYRFNRTHAITQALRQVLAGDGDAPAADRVLYRRFAATAAGCWRELPPAVRRELCEKYSQRVTQLGLTREEEEP